VETLVDQARQILTFLLGSQSSRTSRLRAERRRGIFKFLTKKRASTRRGRGLYHNLVKEIGNTSFFLIESLLNLKKIFLENIQTIGTYLTEINKIYPVQPLRSEIARLSNRLNRLPPLRNRSQALVQLGNIRLKEAKKTLRQILALTTRPAEENCQPIGRRIRRNRGQQRRIPVQSIGFRLRVTFVQPEQRRGILE
jgi:hypothetical protein